MSDINDEQPITTDIEPTAIEDEPVTEPPKPKRKIIPPTRPKRDPLPKVRLTTAERNQII